MKNSILLCTFVSGLIMARDSVAQSGPIDGTFAANIQAGGGANGPVLCTATDPSGNVFVGGSFTQFNGVAANRLAKVLADGTVDVSFTNAVELVGSDVKAIAVQADGKILLGGNFSSVASTARTFLARLNPDGSLDAGFAPALNLPVFAIAVQSDGAILIGGQFFFNPGATRRGVARLLPSGALDSSFDPGTGANNTVRALALDDVGRVVVGGAFTAFNGSAAQHVVLLDTHGASVAGFAPASGADDAVFAAVTLPGDRMLLGGGFDSFNGTASPALVCVNYDGSLDVTVVSGFATSDNVSAMILDMNGLAICGGNFASYAGQARSRIVRVLSNGALDGSFNVGAGFTGTTVSCLTEDPQGRLVTGGTFTAYQGVPENGLTRITNCLQTTYYQDVDGDGLGDHAVAQSACAQPSGYVMDDSDCDDTNSGILGKSTWYQDSDGDGTGNPSIFVLSCAEQAGYVLDNTDCDDQDPSRYEGADCDDGDPTTVFDMLSPNCTCVGGAVDVAAKIFLDGPLNGALMNDGLRASGHIPLTEPYTLLNFHPAEAGGGEQIAPSVLAVTGPDAIVDWVMVVLRDDDPPYPRKNIRMALLQRDGDVVDLNGVSPVRFSQLPGPYMLEIRHRNHLGIMTAAPMPEVPTGTLITVDLSLASTPCFGTNARKINGSTAALWSGNTVRNGLLSYTGPANDRDAILVRVGSTTPNNLLFGYFSEDVNMNGVVTYTGSANDRDPILVNIGNTTPNAVRIEQLP